MLSEPLPVGQYSVSIITEIELLSFPGLTGDQEAALLELLGDVTVVGVDETIKRHCIDLRRTFRLKIPDAIIAATAITLEAELLTNDTTLSQIAALRCRSIRLKQD